MSGDILELKVAMAAASNPTSIKQQLDASMSAGSPSHNNAEQRNNSNHVSLSVADVLSRRPSIRQASASTFLCPEIIPGFESSQRQLSASQLHLLLHPTEEEDDRSLENSKEIMCLNVGGKKHWAMSKNFVHFPGTRLGRIARAKNPTQILEQCDKYFPGEIPEYFFDHNWMGFNSILDVYRIGTLHLMSGMCALVTKNDLEYWGIDELLLEPCCALRYYPEIELCVKEVEGEVISRKKAKERRQAEDFGTSRLGKVRKYLWNLTEYPETSKAAQAAAFTSLGVICISTFCFILSTFPELQDEDEYMVEEEMAKPPESNLELLDEQNLTTTPAAAIDLSALFENSIIDYALVKLILKCIDWMTVGYFCLEYIVRFLCAPDKKKFFFQAMNLVDFLAILPYFISACLESLEDLHILGKAGKIMRLVRVMRILRIFKLVRHFAGLQSLLYTLKQAYKELGLLVILVGVAVLTFSSLVFYAEKDSTDFKWTFIDSFWWGLMTLTTVGYGTQTPSSITGKAIGGFCAIVGVFILTLPVPIVVNSFASYYKNRLWRNEVAHKRSVRAAEQAELVKEILVNQSRRPSLAKSSIEGDDSTYHDESEDSDGSNKPHHHNHQRSRLGPRTMSSLSVPLTGSGTDPINTLTIPVPNLLQPKNGKSSTTNSKHIDPNTTSRSLKNKEYLSVPQK